eukprot:scaffold78327_cov21-Prasinocladus_malaysianus.AAC.1
MRFAIPNASKQSITINEQSQEYETIATVYIHSRKRYVNESKCWILKAAKNQFCIAINPGLNLLFIVAQPRHTNPGRLFMIHPEV